MNDQRKVVFEQRIDLMGTRASTRPSPRCATAWWTTSSTQHSRGRQPSRGLDWLCSIGEVCGVLTLAVRSLMDARRNPRSISATTSRTCPMRGWPARRRAGATCACAGATAHCPALLDDPWLRHLATRGVTATGGGTVCARPRNRSTIQDRAFHLFELMLRQPRRNVTAATMRVGFDDAAPAQPMDSEDHHAVVVPAHLVEVRE